MARRTLRIVVSLLLTAAFVALFLWNVDFAEVGRTLASAHPGRLVAAVLAALFSYWLRAVRWQQILRPAGRTRHGSVVLATVVGYAGITLLPARLGDVLRPVLLSQRDRLPTSATLASILTERILDMWTIVAGFFIFLVAPPPMPSLTAEGAGHFELMRLSGWFVGAGLVVGTAVLFALFRYQERFIDTVTRPLSRLKQSWREAVSNFLHHALDGLRILGRPRDLVPVLLMSLAVWSVIVVQLLLTMQAFDTALPVRGAFLLIAMTVIGLFVPTPGGVGSFHAMFLIGLTLFFGVDQALATGIAIAYHAVCFYPVTIIGLCCIPLFGLSLKVPKAEVSDG